MNRRAPRVDAEQALRLLVIFAAIAATIPLVAAPVPKAEKKVPALLDGHWYLVEMNADSRTLPSLDDSARHVRFEGDGIGWAMNGRPKRVTEGGAPLSTPLAPS